MTEKNLLQSGESGEGSVSSDFCDVVKGEVEPGEVRHAGKVLLRF